MASYKEMYFELFISTSRAIENLQQINDGLKQAHLKAEEMYIETDTNVVQLVVSDSSSMENIQDEERINLTTDKQVIGKNIRAVRQKYSVTSEELANKLDITTTFLGLIERGQRGTTLKNLCIISNFFCVPIERFLIPDGVKHDKVQ